VRDLRAPLSIPGYRRLWTADAISLLGDWAGRLALIWLVHERTGSPGWVAAVTAVSLAGFVGLGQVLATLADRHGRISVMLVADGARALCFVAMLAPMPPAGLLALAFLAGLCSPPFEAARAAALPDLVPEERYGEALALSGMTVQATLVIGYAMGGALVAWVGVEMALLTNAATFLVSAVILLPLRHSPAGEPAGVPSSAGQSLRDAWATIVGDRLIRRALLLTAVTGALGTVAEALVVSHAVEVAFPRGAIGLLAAAVPIGTLVAVACVPTRGDHRRMLRGASVCAMVAAGGALPLFWFGFGGGAALAAFLIVGGIFAVSIPTNAVFGMRLQRGTRASAMGIAVGVLMGSQAVAAALGGLAAATYGTGPTIAVALGLVVVYAAWALVTTPYDARHLARRRVPARPAAGPDVVIDLSGPPEVVRPAALEPQSLSA
jgi:predicted MFS family arabinose efflux permease